jgi:Transposase
VGPKHFQNKARREWWSIHIEAWQRSGLSQRRYCAQHRLTETTFVRWLRVLVDANALQITAELQRQERRERRRKRHFRLSSDKRSQAVQAVEALNWSGLSASHYAAALRISLPSLRRWRDLLAAGEVEIDWRAHLHPSSRPKVSDSTKDVTKIRHVDERLTNPSDEAPPAEQRRRRKFSAEEKLAVVLETEYRGATVSEVARKRGIAAGVLFRWRSELGFSRDKHVELAAVRLDNGSFGASSAPLVLHDLLRSPDGMTAVELPDGRRVFAPEGSDPNVVRRHVAEREMTR